LLVIAVLALWLWITDVHPETAAMRIRAFTLSFAKSRSNQRESQYDTVVHSKHTSNLPVDRGVLALCWRCVDRLLVVAVPGSHKPIQDHWEAVLKPERRQFLPRVHGLFPVPGKNYPSYPGD
jgi:hypothetical protein